MSSTNPGLKLNKIAALVSFGLTAQFLATLGWIFAASPGDLFGTIARLDDRMADYIVEMLGEPNIFMSANLYNVSFGLTALTLVVLLRESLRAAPLRANLAVLWICAAAALYVATGIVPIAGGRALVESGDQSALLSILIVTKGLLLAATFCSGMGLLFAASAAITARFLPLALCALLIVEGVIELFEYASNWFLVLDPLLGSIWSAWLGVILWTKREPIAAPSLMN